MYDNFSFIHETTWPGGIPKVVEALRKGRNIILTTFRLPTKIKTMPLAKLVHNAPFSMPHVYRIKVSMDTVFDFSLSPSLSLPFLLY